MKGNQESVVVVDTLPIEQVEMANEIDVASLSFNKWQATLGDNLSPITASGGLRLNLFSTAGTAPPNYIDGKATQFNNGARGCL